ncbi:hypothetical protein N0V83_007312 [Neocucurbitaria cava]|uniref:Aminotransferase class I/classII large domain-containing protein n=1 Tax=Neocucurbitaria cava TaxID=798079 RepID=A0A9W9CK63_9PLEO|nr:hypothetical protein N0V83_007312 [Neocucurbitaria cava]
MEDTGLHALHDALATHLNDYFNPYQPVKSEHISVAASTTAFHDILAFSLAAPGEGILTSRPHYGRFDIDFGDKAGVKLVLADTDHETCFDESVVDAFEDALVKSEKEGVKIRALLIVNPHNPLGRCYPKSTLVALMHFCARHTIHLISDEIYACSFFPNASFPSAPPFTSLLSIDPTGIIDASLIHVEYGLSKDFGAAGLRIGVFVTRNEQLKSAVDAVGDRFHGVAGPSVALGVSMLGDREWVHDFIALSRERIAEQYAFTTSRLRDMGIEFFEGGNAGFFLWVDFNGYLPPREGGLSDREREIKFAEKCIEGGVFLHPGEEKNVRSGWFRMVFTMERKVVEEGLRRLEGVLKGLKW